MATFVDSTRFNGCDMEILLDATEQLNDTNNSDCVEICVIDDSPLVKKLKVADEENTRPSTGKLSLQGDELIEFRKHLRERSKKIKRMPKLHLKLLGDKASLDRRLEDRYPILLADVQSLIVCSQTGIHWPYVNQRWYQLEKYNNLESVIVIIVENLSIYHYQAFESYFEFTRTNFEIKVEVVTPFVYDCDLIKEISMVPLTSTEMHRLVKKYGSLEEAAKNHCNVFNMKNNVFPIETASNEKEFDNKLKTADKFPRTDLLLSVWEMVTENFALPIKGLMERKYIGYKLTKKKYKPASRYSPLIAIDCEMCKTDTGDLELTRISVIDEAHNVLLDTLVKPRNKIIDYLTRYSGITPKLLKKVSTRLEDVQEKLISILPEDAILIGHSLSNDLHALKLMHPYVIDTSVIYNVSGQEMYKPKLQTLARIFLNENIQIGHKGHCSAEDSLTCMKLTQLKLKNDINFGDANFYKRSAPIELVFNTEFGFSKSLIHECTDSQKKINISGVNNNCDKYKYYVNKNMPKTIENVKFHHAETNKTVINYLCQSSSKYNLNIGHLRVAEDQINDDNLNERTKTFKLIDRWIKKIYESSKEPALIMVLFSGQKHLGNGVCFSTIKRTYIE